MTELAEPSRIQNAIGVVEHPIGVAERTLASRMRDFTGERIGEAVVIARMGSTPNQERLWVLRCDCDNEFVLTTNRITAAKRLGDEICCPACRLELRGGKRVVKADIRTNFYRRLWAKHHSLWSRHAEDWLTRDVMNALIEEFGPLPEEQGEPAPSTMTIDPSWSQNWPTDPERALSFVELHVARAPACSWSASRHAGDDAPAPSGIGQYPRPGAYARVASRYDWHEYAELIDAAYKRAKAAPLAAEKKPGQRQPPPGMMRPDRERLAQVARDMAPPQPVHSWSPNRVVWVGTHEAQIGSDCTCGRKCLLTVVRPELEAILRGDNPADVGRFGQPQYVDPRLGWHVHGGQHVLVQLFDDHGFFGVVVHHLYAHHVLELMLAAERATAP